MCLITLQEILFLFLLLHFLFASLTPFISQPDASRNLTIFISSISLFEIITAVVPDPKFIFLIAASVAEAAAIKPNGIKTLYANGVTAFFINGKPADINGLRKLRNPPSSRVIFLVVPFNKTPLFF